MPDIVHIAHAQVAVRIKPDTVYADTAVCDIQLVIGLAHLRHQRRCRARAVRMIHNSKPAVRRLNKAVMTDAVQVVLRVGAVGIGSNQHRTLLFKRAEGTLGCGTADCINRAAVTG